MLKHYQVKYSTTINQRSRQRHKSDMVVSHTSKLHIGSGKWCVTFAPGWVWEGFWIQSKTKETKKRFHAPRAVRRNANPSPGTCEHSLNRHDLGLNRRNPRREGSLHLCRTLLCVHSSNYQFRNMYDNLTALHFVSALVHYYLRNQVSSLMQCVYRNLKIFNALTCLR